MNILITNTSNEPLYQQIKRQLKRAIISGELMEGAQLPSIRIFANELEVSVITIRRVYEELEAEGYIVSQIGAGTFVLGNNLELHREAKMYIIEQKMEEIVEESIDLGLQLDELIDRLSIIYRER